ncbi:MAG: hypothetical protein KAH08_08390, partial [Methylococcales bacterium]|nr:hypothetical protein [Methylococcales bacterium]
VVVEFFQAKLSTNNSSYLFILFLLMLGLKQKEIKEIYGKYMANKVIPRLLKGSNAEYFLEKYDYYEIRQ